MGRTLTTMLALGALALAPVPTAHASGAVTSATLSQAPAQQPDASRRPAPAAGYSLRGPGAGLAQTGGRRLRGLYLGGATGRFVQFFSLRVNRRATRATERATVVVGCRGDPSIRTVLDQLTLSPIALTDGLGRGTGAFEETIPPSVPTVGGLTRSGTLNYRVRVGTLGRAAGILRSRFTLTDPATGETRARCDTGRLRWSARIAPRGAGQGDPAPVGGSGYFGATRQRLPFLLEVLPGGRAVRPAGMTFRASCPSLRGLPLDLVAQTKMPISRGRPKTRRRKGRPGGRFGGAGRFTRRYSSEEFGPITESYTWRLRGRFGATGVAGSWRVTGIVIREADGVEVDNCTTGSNAWRAVQ